MLVKAARDVRTVEVQQVGTVLESIYIDVYFSAGASTPYLYSTASIATVSILNKNDDTKTTTLSTQSGSESSKSQESVTLSTEIVVQLIGSSKSVSASTTSFSAMSSTTTPTVVSSTGASSTTSTNVIVDKMTTTNTSSDVIGISIGLPVGIFCCGLIFIIGFLWYRNHRKQNSRSYDTEKTNYDNFNPRKTSSRMWFGKKKTVSNSFNHGMDEEMGSRCDEVDNLVGIKISKMNSHPYSHPYSHHVKTPQKSMCPPNRSLSSQHISTLLYSQPPGIQYIDSEMPSSNTTRSKIFLAERDQRQLPRGGNWNYESPLSRWFLTKSTYLQDQVIPNLKTPTIKLKQLNILSRVGKHRGESFLVNERSPVLEDSHTPSETSVSEGEGSKLDPLIFRNTSLNYTKVEGSHGSTAKTSSGNNPRDSHMLTSAEIANYNPYSRTQTFNSIVKPQYIDGSSLDVSTLIRPPLLNFSSKTCKANQIDRKGTEEKRNKLAQRLNQIHEEKPLPMTPSHGSEKPALIVNWSSLEQKLPDEIEKHNTENLSHTNLNEICVVVREYIPKLMDEIHIKHGDHVRLLAKHTDGWCLIEKCGKDGKVIKANDAQNDNIDGEHYLNDYRGIVPGVCLRTL